MSFTVLEDKSVPRTDRLCKPPAWICNALCNFMTAWWSSLGACFKNSSAARIQREAYLLVETGGFWSQPGGWAEFLEGSSLLLLASRLRGLGSGELPLPAQHYHEKSNYIKSYGDFSPTRKLRSSSLQHRKINDIIVVWLMCLVKKTQEN